MGNRFTRCFSTLQYSVVESTAPKKNNRKYTDSSKEAIALKLDDGEEENPGIILGEHY
jgi:hypothetical protein